MFEVIGSGIKRGKFIKAKQVAEPIRDKHPSNRLDTQLPEYINKVMQFKEYLSSAILILEIRSQESESRSQNEKGICTIFSGFILNTHF